MANFMAGFAAGGDGEPLVAFNGASMNLAARVTSFLDVVGDFAKQAQGVVDGGQPAKGPGKGRRKAADEEGGAREASALGLATTSKPTVALGGRSMGARAAVRAASALADQFHTPLVLGSYPLISPTGGKAERAQILLDLPAGCDVLFISGDKDHMCPLDELDEVRKEMKAQSWLAVVPGAGHGMDVAGKQATKEIGEACGRLAREWLKERDQGERVCEVRWSREKGRVIRTSWAEQLAATAAAGDQAGRTTTIQNFFATSTKERPVVDEQKAPRTHAQKPVKAATIAAVTESSAEPSGGRSKRQRRE